MDHTPWACALAPRNHVLQLLKFEHSARAPRQEKPLIAVRRLLATAREKPAQQPRPSTANKRRKGDGTHASSVNVINIKINFLTVRKAVINETLLITSSLFSVINIITLNKCSLYVVGWSCSYQNVCFLIWWLILVLVYDYLGLYYLNFIILISYVCPRENVLFLHEIQVTVSSWLGIACIPSGYYLHWYYLV